MAEAGVAEVVGQRHRLGEILVEAEGAADRARDLRHLDRVGSPRAVVIALVVDEDLGLVLQPREGSGLAERAEGRRGGTEWLSSGRPRWCTVHHKIQMKKTNSQE